MSQNLAEHIKKLAKRFYDDDTPRIEIDDRGRVYGTIVSGSFSGMPEEDRQADLYRHVEEELGSDAVKRLLFIFTNTPDEDEIFNRNEAADMQS